jgi:hypothetical protein
MLCGLSVLVLEQVCSYLSARDVCALLECCRTLRIECARARIWTELLRRDYFRAQSTYSTNRARTIKQAYRKYRKRERKSRHLEKLSTRLPRNPQSWRAVTQEFARSRRHKYLQVQQKIARVQQRQWAALEYEQQMERLFERAYLEGDLSEEWADW